MPHPTEKLSKNIFLSTKLPFNPPFFYGWIIVLMGALSMFFSGPGQTFAISVFIDAYILHFGWDRTTISSIYSIATLLAGLSFFLVGRMVDRYGQRKVTMMIAFLLGLACLWNSFIVGPVMMFIGFFMTRILGQGSMTLLPSTLIPQWFSRYRGRALSFMSVGIMLSAATLPPLNLWLIHTWGWPNAWRFWAALLLFFFLPLAFVFIRNKPEDVGLLPDNRKVRPIGKKGQTGKIEEQREVSWTLREAMGTRTFWMILFCAAVPAMVNTGLIFHLFSIMQEKGVEAHTTALLLSMIPIVGFIFTLVAGFLVERIKVHYVYAAAFGLKVVLMTTLFFADSLSMIFLFGFLWGIFEGCMMICMGIIWPNYFGLKHLGSIRSIATTAIVSGSAFGPLPFGWAYDNLGSYQQIILLMMLFPFVAMIFALLSPAPKKKIG